MCQAPTTEGMPDFPAGGRLSFMLLPLLALHVAPGAWKAGLFSREAAGRNAQDVFFLLLLLCFWLPWVFLALCGLSLLVVSEGISLVSVRQLLLLQSTALEYVGFSSWGARA